MNSRYNRWLRSFQNYSSSEKQASLQRALISPIEMLEQRIMLSISSSLLAGPVTTPGTQWSYQLTTAKGKSASYIRRVNGPATFNGNSCYEIDQGTSASNLNFKYYYGFDGAGDYVNFGDVLQLTAGGTQTDTFSPYRGSIPASLTAGVVITNSDTDTITFNDSTGMVSTSTTQETITNTLVSATASSVTVSGKNYSAYKDHYTQTDTDSLGNVTTGSTDFWFAPNVGLVQSIDSNGNTVALTNFSASQDHLSILPVTGTDAGKTMAPVIVSAVDSTGKPDVNASGSVTISLNSFPRSGPGSLTGTLMQPLVKGVATFGDLKISQDGPYQLHATDTNTDPPADSNIFTIGQTSLQLQITSRAAPPRKNGARTGDIILYSLTTTTKKPLESQVIVDAVPPGITPTGITGGGVYDPAASTITWNPITPHVSMNFDIKIPDAVTLTKAINGASSIPNSATDDVVYTDSTTETATASNSVKLELNFDVSGTLNDVLFNFPSVQRILTDIPLGKVTVNLIDDTGATAVSTVTAANGKFSLTAPKGGTYTLEFVAVTDSYSSDSNFVNPRSVYAGETLDIPASNTKATPIKAGTLVLPAAFFNQSAKILHDLNNYTTSQFQGLAAFNLDLYQFNTTAAEGVLTGLAGTADNPSPLLNPMALKAVGGGDVWVSAIRMMSGLQEVNQRFMDTLKLADVCGKSIGVLAGAGVAKLIGKTFGKAISKSTSLFSAFSSTTAQTLMAKAVKISALTAVGAELPALADFELKSYFPAATKNTSFVIIFNVLRYAADAFTGQLVTDLGFETVFNLVRLVCDTAMLEFFAGVSVRTDLAAPWSQIGAAASAAGLNQSAIENMQDVIDQSVANRAVYQEATDTSTMLDALGRFDDFMHLEAQKGLRNFAILNGISSFLRGTLGVLEVQGVAEKIGPLPEGQAGLQNVLTKANGALSGLFGKSASQLQTDALLGALFATLLSLGEQNFYTDDVPGILQTATFSSIFADGVSTGKTGSPSTGSASLTPPQAVAQPAALQTASSYQASASKAATSDSAVFLSDLSNMSSLVKAGNAGGIAAFYPQFSTDEQALFNNDLVVLDNEAGTLLGQLSTANKSKANSFDLVLNNAINTTLLAVMQMEVWGDDTATGNVKAVTAQITAAMSAISTAAKQAAGVRAVVARYPIPVTLEIDEASIPVQVSVGTTQSLTFTVTNIGSQPATPGTIVFSNSDGSLILQSPAQQDLPQLAPGASSSFTWQVDVITPPNPSTGSVFQVQAVAGNATASVTDQVVLG